MPVEDGGKETRSSEASCLSEQKKGEGLSVIAFILLLIG